MSLPRVQFSAKGSHRGQVGKAYLGTNQHTLEGALEIDLRTMLALAERRNRLDRDAVGLEGRVDSSHVSVGRARRWLRRRNPLDQQ